MPEPPAPKPSQGSSSLLLLLAPLACCGLPLLILGASALGAALGPAVAGIALVGVVLYALARRRSRVRDIACCAPESSASTARHAGAETNGTADARYAPAPPSLERTREPV